jgi:hypothetical protein
MYQILLAAVRWLRVVWSDSPDPSVQTWRRHVRGIFSGWGVTAGAMALIGLYPDSLHLSMYQVMLDSGLPWQQQALAALEVAGPLVMAWHLLHLQRWGSRRYAD